MTLALHDPSLLESRALLAGGWEDGPGRYPVTNPATGETVAEVADLGAADVRRAIDAAYDSQKGWAALIEVQSTPLGGR